MNEFSSHVEALQNALYMDDTRNIINAQEQLDNATRRHMPLDSDFSRSFAFWDNLISMILILLHFMEAERKISWNFHLHVVKTMIPYFTNYSRWTPVYIGDMEELHAMHQMYFSNLCQGTTQSMGHHPSFLLFGLTWHLSKVQIAIVNQN